MRPVRQVSHVEGRGLHRIPKVGLGAKRCPLPWFQTCAVQGAMMRSKVKAGGKSASRPWLDELGDTPVVGKSPADDKAWDGGKHDEAM